MITDTKKLGIDVDSRDDESDTEDFTSSGGQIVRFSDDYWQLCRNVKINVVDIARLLEQDVGDSFKRVLKFYASNYSSHHSRNCASQFLNYIRATGTTKLTPASLINYRSQLTRKTEWKLGTLRGFLRRWHRLGYSGVDEDVIRLLGSWVLKGNEKGEVVKQKDPTKGQLTDIELLGLIQSTAQQFEAGEIPLSDFVIFVLLYQTGRRSCQIADLKSEDVPTRDSLANEADFAVIKVPRAKQRGLGFRDAFRTFAIDLDTHYLLREQCDKSLDELERILGRKMEQSESNNVPLFVNLAVARKLDFRRDYSNLLQGDKLHISSAQIRNSLKRSVKAADVKSERTGKRLAVSPRRLRYTIGSRAAREGYGELVIAELLDHSDTQNVSVYCQNVPEHVEAIDNAVGRQMSVLAQAFAGQLVKRSEQEHHCSSVRLNDVELGGCASFGYCGANVPIPCYVCPHFRAWEDGPHEKLLEHLLGERDRLLELTGDITIANVNDRSILAVQDVIQRCSECTGSASD